MKIKRPKEKSKINGKQNITVADILPYLPEENVFFDCRHWVCESINGVMPFAITTRIAANDQQFLLLYESEN